MWGLADCNNFFVSCERTVDPTLEGKAVVVLSNNDGCVVARSNESKRLGVKMGQPAFEIRDMINRGEVIALSGNHLLYREISLKVHDIFRRFVPNCLDYSVDEAFLDVSGVAENWLMTMGQGIVDACLAEAKIPVTVGFAPTKTLAKIATELGKHSDRRVVILSDRQEIEAALRDMPIGEIWGIGRRYARRLYLKGVYTAADFANRPMAWVRQQMGVNGEKTWRELNGQPCIELQHLERNIQDSISETRTFPMDVTDYDYLRSRITIYAADCARRLRDMRARCAAVSTFLRTNRFHTENGYYAPTATAWFRSPLNDTQEIVDGALRALSKIYNPEFAYKRGGVLLTGITAAEAFTPSLFADEENGEVRPQQDEEHRARLFKAIDSINHSVGTPVIRLASQLVAGQPGHNDGYSSSFQSPSTREKKRPG